MGTSKNCFYNYKCNKEKAVLYYFIVLTGEHLKKQFLEVPLYIAYTLIVKPYIYLMLGYRNIWQRMYTEDGYGVRSEEIIIKYSNVMNY